MKKLFVNSFILLHWFSRKKSYSGKTLKSALLGIIIGTLALTVILSVMNGFQLTFINAILHYDSYHIRIKGNNSEVYKLLQSNDLIQNIFLFSEQTTLIMLKKSPPIPIKLKYITEKTAHDLGLFKTITKDQSVLAIPYAIIGSELARKINRSSSQTIQFLEFAVSEEDGIQPEIKEVELLGSFNSGYLDIDESFVFIIVPEQTLLSQKNIQTGIILKNKYDYNEIIQAIPQNLSKSLDLSIWKDYNRSFFNALQLEKNMMILLVSIIYLVVAINIYYGLRRIIVEKYNDIALLKAIGLTGHDVQSIVVLIGIFLGISGTLIGIFIGVITSNNINCIIRIINWLIDVLAPKTASESVKILSQNSFYLVSIPHNVLISDLVIIMVLATFFSTISAWYASFRIAYLRPSEVLRYE